MFCSCFVVKNVLYFFIFVCTSVGLLPPGESPIAVNNNIINNNNDNNKQQQQQQHSPNEKTLHPPKKLKSSTTALRNFRDNDISGQNALFTNNYSHGYFLLVFINPELRGCI